MIASDTRIILSIDNKKGLMFVAHIHNKTVLLKFILFDIPKLYSTSTVSYFEDPEVVPLYTLCELDQQSTFLTVHPIGQAFGFLPTCNILWNSYVHDSANDDIKNPNLIPKNDPLGLCGKGIMDVAK